jgi:transposase
MNVKHDTLPSFKNQDFHIGIDVHKNQWTVSVISMNMLLKKFQSIDPSPSVLLKYMQRLYPDGNFHVAYESGFSGFWAARKFKDLGVDCMVIHASDVPSSQKERLNKNDRVDSRKIARSLSNGELMPIYIPEKVAEEYRYLNRHRLKTIKDQTRLKNRIKSVLHQFGFTIPLQYQERRWSGAFINWLLTIKFDTEYAQFAYDDLVDQFIQTRARITTQLKKMRAMAKEQTPFNTLIPLLLTVPGIGFITAMTLVTEIIDMDRFNTLEKLASYVGLIPSIQSSDETEINYGITPRRNKYLRTMLVEAAWKAVKIDPALTMKFNQLSRRMHRNKAIVRIAKILLNRIRFVWKNQKPYVLSVVN